MRKKYFYLLVIATIVGSIFSCSKEKLDFTKISNHLDWNPSIGTPVAYANLTLRDLLADYDSTELFVEDATQLLSVMYTGNVSSMAISDLFSFPSQVYEETYTAGEMDLGGFLSPGDVIHDSKTKDFNLTFEPSDAIIDSILLDSANMQFQITSTFKHDGRLTIKFPGIIKPSGEQYSIILPAASSTGSFSIDTTISDLTNCTVDFTQNSGLHGEFKIFYEVELTHSGNTTTAGQFDMKCTIKNVKYDKVYGYLGQQEIMYSSDTFNLDILTPATDDGVLYFEDPQFEIFYDNSYGVPISLYFTEITAFSSEYNTSTPIISYGNEIPMGESNAMIVAYPDINEIGDSKLDSIKLNKSNSNINTAIGDKPKKISFGAKATTNKAGIIYDNFITKNSVIDTKVEVTLPLWGYASGFTLQDTSDFDFDEEFTDITEIERALLRLNIKNGFPVEIRTQAYFTDSLYNIVDSVIMSNDTKIVASGNIGTDGKINQSSGRTSKTTDFILDRAKIERMKGLKIKHVILTGYMETKSNPSLVKIYADYSVYFHIAVQIDFNSGLTN